MKENEEVKKLQRLYERAHSARTSIDHLRQQWEEFYWNDVDNTRSQFTSRQQSDIAKSYDIPLSTKIAYPIIEQMLSFLTGSKPFPRLVGTTNQDSAYAAIYAEAYKAVWYESKSKRELRNALRDMLVVGTGYMRVRTNNIFDESTFNVVHEYVRWKHVYVDPESRKEDLSDAEYIIITHPMPKSKAEKRFDIKIPDRSFSLKNSAQDVYSDDLIQESSLSGGKNNEEKVVPKEFFIREEKNVYVTENGDIGLKKPTPIEVPNPAKEQLGQQIEQYKQYLQELSKAKFEVTQAIEKNASLSTNPAVPEVKDELGYDESFREKGREIETRIQEAITELQGMSAQYGQLPDTIPAYKLINERDEEIICFEATRIRKVRTKYTLLINDEIIEQKYLPIESNSVVAFTLQHAGSVNNTYGIMHYILDMNKFLNKTYSMLIYDMMTHSRPKMLFPKGSIIDIKKWEESYSLPSAMLDYVPNPQLPDGGKPEMLQPMQLSQVITFVIQQMTQLVEYVTGVHGVLMGDPSGMPNTASATSSLQNFGTQRIKLYARGIEPALELLASTTVEYLQQYAPKDKELLYIDDNLKDQALIMLNTKEDLKFKVRVDIVNDLPTVRQQMATMLGVIAGQTGSPYVADALTKQMIKLLDMPEFTQLASDIDMMKQLQSENQQLKQSLQSAESQIKVFQHNEVQKDAKAKTDKAVAEHKANLKIQEAEQSKNNNFEPTQINEEF